MDIYTNENSDFQVENSKSDAIAKSLIDGIQNAFDSFIESHNIDDMKTESQNVFNAALMYCNFNYISIYRKYLYKYSRGISNNGYITNEYDYYIIDKLVDYYIYLCCVYNKVSSIAGFCFLLGLNQDTVQEWGRDNSQRPDAGAIYKKLRFSYENALENGAQNGKNPVGYIAALNHRFAWNTDNKPALTVNITRTRDEILNSVNTALLSDTVENP